jgi:hypothetical protein
MDSLLAPLLSQGITQLLLYIASVGGVATAVPMLLELLKGRVPFVNKNHAVILRMVTAVATLATSVGIGYSYDLGTGKLVIDGMTPANLAVFVLGVAGQAGLTEHIYRRFIKNGPLTR